jgi:hypothetical protein
MPQQPDAPFITQDSYEARLCKNHPFKNIRVVHASPKSHVNLLSCGIAVYDVPRDRTHLTGPRRSITIGFTVYRVIIFCTIYLCHILKKNY